MPGIQDLREARAEKARALKNLADSNANSWTPAHGKKCDGLIAEIDALDDQIANFQRVLDRTADEIAGGRIGSPRTPGRTPADTQAMMAAVGEFARSGNRDGFATVMGAALTEDPSSGGILVPRELSDVIVSTQKKYDPLRTVARVLNISTTASKFDQPVFNGTLDSGWVGETDSRPAGSISALSSVAFPDAEVFANVPISAWLEEDSRVGEFIVTEIAKEFSRKEGQAFHSGTGTKQPLGFLASTQATTADETRALGAVQTLVPGTGGTSVTADLLTDLLYLLKPSYRANSTWAMNSKTLAAVRKLKDSTGAFLWQPALMAGQPELLLGRPIVELENMPDVAAGAIPVAIADWNEAYYILDRTQILLRDPYTNKPYVNFYCRKRVSGAVVDSNAIKLLKLAAS